MIAGFADAAIDPIDFPTAPAHAIPKVRFLLLTTYGHPRIPRGDSARYIDPWDN